MLDIATRVALGPLLVAQATRLRRTALELPEPRGARAGTIGRGTPVLRLLVAGDSSAAGVGARTAARGTRAAARRAAGTSAGGCCALAAGGRVGPDL